MWEDGIGELDVKVPFRSSVVAIVVTVAATTSGGAPVTGAASNASALDSRIAQAVQLGSDGSGTVQVGNARAQIRSFDGTGKPVPASVGLIQRAIKDAGREAYELVWEVGIDPTPAQAPAAVDLNPMALVAYEQGGCSPDPSYSISGCIYEDFYLKDDGVLYYVNAYAAKERWTTSDRTAALISSSGSAGSFGRTCTGLWPQHTTTFSNSRIASGTTYTYPISWNAYVQLLPSYSYSSANFTLKWQRGTATYYFTIAWGIAPQSWPYYSNCS